MTSKLLVDSIEGRTTHGFLTPDRPAFTAYQSGSAAHQEVTHNTYVILPLNATDFNIGGHLILAHTNLLRQQEAFIIFMRKATKTKQVG